MAKGNLAACLDVVLVYEGGYSNHPKDPGGVTLEGVIQRVYDDYRRGRGLALKALTAAMRGTAAWIAERNAIYEAGYWRMVRGDDLQAGVDLCVFDFGVNSGPSRSIKYLQAVVGVAQDGRPGPVTLQAAAKANGKATIQAICRKRLGFLQGLAIWETFKRGWSRRVVDVEAKAVAMWLRAAGKAPAEARADLSLESAKARNQAAKQQAGVGGAGGGGAVVGGNEALTPNPDWLLIGGVGTVVAIVLVVLIVKAVQNRQRAEAYAVEAAGV